MLEKPPIGAPCNACGLCCRITVCSAGSYAMRLVDTYGQRASGPCPALTQQGERQVCGVMLRPTDRLRSKRGPTVLRQAFGVLIASGLGCDEAGDEPDATAQPKLDVLRRELMRRFTVAELQRAVDIVNDP